MKNMLLVGLMLLNAARLLAGYSVSVCDSLDKQGNCLNPNTVFHYTGDRMMLYVSVRNKEMLNTSKIYFKLYTMSNDNDGEIYAELSAAIKPEWFVAVKRLYFVKPGYYRLDVLDAGKKKISSSFITISDR